MLYDKVSPQLNFVERERAMMEFWREHHVEKLCQQEHADGPHFTIYDGPPTANGRPHIGHVLTRAVKDIVPRYMRMKGRSITFKAGWDTHGLPVELEVEKLLGLDGKPQIESYGVEPFIARCKESVWKYKSEWEDISQRVAYTADMEHPYVTYDNNYIESEWWALKTIYDKGLLYKGHKVVPYCPRCGTALSSHEVAQGYKDVEETSVTARFKVKGQDNTYILAWTTTPWTLPSNVGLCVNAGYEYIKARVDGEYLILAGALAEKVLPEGYEVVERFTGAQLVGMQYEQLMPFVAMPEGGCRVVADDYVTLEDGTGVVHTAPAFGEDDYRVCKDNGLPFIQPVDAQGRFIGTPWAGTFVKDADPAIIDYLREQGLLYQALPYEHNYPFCWRCDTPLLYYARSTWFVAMSQVKEDLIANNRSVNWMPENIKEGRMGNFLENVIDWGLSRERYWGTPLPVWECECGHIEVIGSRAELAEKGVDCPTDIELHKPYVDQVHLKCPCCGGLMKRVSEVIDCWFDSGSMPFAQWHYPFENKEIFEANFPADFISEAIDQTRGWFYTLLAISTVLFNKAPFKNCIVLGHVNDKDGVKMSKHKGNVIDPWTVLDKQGADAVRWYFYTGSAPWLPSRFSEEAVSDAQRRFMGTLWNSYAFYVLYANIDGFDPTKAQWDKENLPAMDAWLLSRLNTLIRDVDGHLAAYRITEGGRALAAFVDEMSNWYVRRCRERFWAKGMEADKVSAYMTLYTALTTLIRLAAPYVPFITESIYQNLVRRVDASAPLSVHMTDFPVCDVTMIDTQLEEHMQALLTVVGLGRSARNAAGMKNRQPLSRLFIQGEPLPERYTALIADELNVKAVEYIDDASTLVDYEFKPQMRTLGPRLGKLLPAVREALKQVDGSAFMAQLKQAGQVQLTVGSETVTLAPEDLLIATRQKAGLVSQQQGDTVVLLDTNLTDALIEEGLMREIISKVQNMRKDAGFEVTDHIALGYAGDGKLPALIERNGAAIAAEVLADSVQAGLEGYEAAWKIDGEDITLSVKRMG